MRPLLAVLALAGALTACSESPEDVRADYCEVVQDQQVALSEALADEGPASLLAGLPIFEDLAAEAPRDIDDEWTVFIAALEDLDEALDDAGVDAATYDAEKPPEGVTEEQQEAIARAASELVTVEVSNAFNGVQQHAKDICKTPLYQ